MIFQERYSQFKNCPFMPDKECTGASCGGWRWHDPEEPVLQEIEHSDPLAVTEPDIRPKDVPRDYVFWPCDPTEGTDACWFEPESEAEARRRGYCGFAGKWRHAE